MISKDKVRDGLEFFDENNSKVIFNFHSWVELMKGILINYYNKNETEAESLLHMSSFVSSPVNDYMAVVMRSHESEYHWATLALFGESYWLKEVSVEEPDGYLEWEDNYREIKSLASESFVFID